MSEFRNIAIVGAGVIGLACARALQAEGHRVTLYDPAPTTDESAAWGSAGILAPDTVVPLATPEMLRRLPGLLLGADSPFVLRWNHALRAFPWLVRCLWNARPARAEYNTAALAGICAQAVAEWHVLLEPDDVAALIRPGGWVTAFESRHGLSAAHANIERRRRNGVQAEWLDGPALRARVPELAEHVVGGVWFPDAHTCVDPGALLETLGKRVDRDGGVFRHIRVHSIAHDEGGVRLQAGKSLDRFDRVLVCAGARSRKLARTLGDDFPLDTERGYHVMLTDRPGPALPVMSGEHRFVTTPMIGGVRLTGTSELAGLSRPPDRHRYELLRRQAARLFPGLDTSGGGEWMGFRPTFPDSLPVIGPSPRSSRVWYALGHQHLGLTLAAVTARMIADAMAERPSVVDRRPFRVDRF